MFDKWILVFINDFTEDWAMPESTASPNPRIHRGLLVVVLAATGAIAMWGLWRAWTLQEVMILDESGIYAQVRMFLEGRFELFRWPSESYPASAMFPGFQAVLAATAAVTGFSSISMLRVYAFGFSLCYAGTAYQVARQFFPPDIALLRAVQCYLLPIVFPYNFLIYTDVFSLLVILCAFWAMLRGKWNLGGALAILSLLVRQNNIVFLLFLWGFTLVKSHGFHPRREQILGHLRRCWLLGVGVIAFALFVLIHGRVGLDAPQHQPTTISLGNLAMSVVVAGILFFPLHVTNRLVASRWARKHWIAASVLLLAALAMALTYSAAHPWNFIPEMLRNQLIVALTQSWAWRLVFAFAMVAVVLSVRVTPLVKPAAVLVYPFGVWCYYPCC